MSQRGSARAVAAGQGTGALDRQARFTERGTTRGWPNKVMRVLLRTPGLDRVLGRSVALLAFEGRRSGKVYETPVSYARSDGTVMVLSRASRAWWRNLRERPVVRVRLAGKDYLGRSTVRLGVEAELDTVVDFLARRRFDAKAYGVALGSDGRPNEADVQRLLPLIVSIRIDLTEHITKGRTHTSRGGHGA